MNRKSYSKSALFLVELLMNLLLFSFLCGCGLLFFIKSHNLTQDATNLHHAVRISTSIASIYESSDGSLDTIWAIYENKIATENSLHIYFDKAYNNCPKEDALYCVTVTKPNAATHKIQIEFHDQNDRVIHSIRACCLIPTTPKEVTLP